MPRFYFDLPRQSDDLGVDLPDAAAARRYAVRYASEVIRDLPDEPREIDGLRLDVRRDDGAAMFSLTAALMLTDA